MYQVRQLVRYSITMGIITRSSLFNQLKKDISEHDNGIVHWSKHFKHEDPTFSDTFNNIIKKLSDDFKLIYKMM